MGTASVDLGERSHTPRAAQYMSSTAIIVLPASSLTVPLAAAVFHALSS